MCPDPESSLLRLLEEIDGKAGNFEPETQTDASSASPLFELGLAVGDGTDGATMVGSPAANVDTINELIQSDHHYHKQVEESALSPSSPCVEVLSTVTASQEGIVPDQALPSSQTVVMECVQETVSPVMTSSTVICSDIAVGDGEEAVLGQVVDPNEVCDVGLLHVKTEPTPTSGSNVIDIISSLEDLINNESLLGSDSLTCSTSELQQQQALITSPTAAENCTSAKRLSRKRKMVLPATVTFPGPVSDDSSNFIYELDHDETFSQGSPDSGFSSGSPDPHRSPSFGDSFYEPENNFSELINKSCEGLENMENMNFSGINFDIEQFFHFE